MRGSTLCLVATIILALSASVTADAAVAARVSVTMQDLGSMIKYTYTVQNNSNQPIVSVRIGLDYLHGVAELRTPPSGWQPATGLAVDSASSPQGWTVELITEEESEFFNLEWSSATSAGFDIAPASIVTGFSIRVPKTATEYKLPQFDIVFGDATHAYGRAELATAKQRAVRH